MRVTWRVGIGRRSGQLRRLGSRLRRVGTGTGVLALAVPLAWPSGVGGQHLDLPSAASVQSGVVRLADFVSGQGTPAGTTQTGGAAAGKNHPVPAWVAQARKHVTGHAPGKGKGQLPPAPAAHRPSAPKGGTFTAPPRGHGFDPATSTLVASGTTAGSDLYKNADGSYTRKVWAGPANYKTPSGSWAAIDDSLVQGPDTRWQEKANSLGVSFAASGSDPALVTLGNADGSQQVSFSLAGAAAAAAAPSGTSVTYAGILPDTGLTETAGTDGVTEMLTLNSAAAGTSWTFPLTLKGLTASLNGDSVDLTDSSGTVVGVIPPAVATSGPVDPATGSQASSQLTYQLVTENGVQALEMNLDPSWLSDPGRAFPVTVAQTVKEDPQGPTYVEQQGTTNETTNNSAATRLPSGTHTDSGVTYKDIDFLDFSEIGASLPGEHVTSASVNLLNNYAPQCTTSEPVSAYQVTGSWSPSQSLTYPGPEYGAQVAQWTGTASAQACANTSRMPGNGSWITLPLNSSGLGLLNAWTGGNGTPNEGFAVVTSLTDAQAFKQFDSAADSNVTSAQGGQFTGDLRPYLSVTFTADVPPQVNSQFPPDNYNSPTLTPELIASASDPDSFPDASPQYLFSVYDSSQTLIASSGTTPISSAHWTVPAGHLQWGKTYFWSVMAYDGTDYSANPVVSELTTSVPQPLITSQLSQNPAGPGFGPQTGNWTTSATDAQVATAGPALEITRDYNSTDPRASGAFGAGWSSVLDMKVTSGQDGGSGPDTEVVTYPDGQDVAFGLNPDGTTYSPPPGRYATLASVSGGFTLTDKNDTVYKFTQPLTSGGYGITSITDALNRTEAFTWNGTGQITSVTAASGRTLSLSWGWAPDQDYPHVSSVTTDDATTGNASTAQHWTYHYSGDDLSSACPPASTTVCTAYQYTPGSEYPDAVLDSNPESYWRLDETSGNLAASSVLANEGADVSGYSAVTLGQDQGPLPGSAATAATFNAASKSYVTLPSKLVSGASYQTVSMWFKTSATDEVLFSYEKAPITNGSTTARWVPTIYIGTDGKLNAQYWNGTASPMQSSSPVNDGEWHQVTLAADAGSQTLYLDGAKVNTLPGTLDVAGMADNYVGTGYNGGAWPDEQYNGASTATPEYFTGDIADVAFWTRQLTDSEAAALYSTGTRPAALLTKLTRPSGSVYAQVDYDPLTGRVTNDTDSNGATWKLKPPQVAGSSQSYVGSVFDAQPKDYWRLNDIGGTWAADQVGYCGCSQPAVYYNAGEGVTGVGPFPDSQVASFNGTNAYLDVPAADTVSGGQASVGVWFNTSGTSEVLYSEATGEVTAGPPSAYDPVLYIGQDGKLNGEFADGNTTVAKSTAAVNDGKWHYAVLAAGASSQSLYVDGTLQGTISGSVSSQAWTNAAAGAGFLGGTWPDIPSSTVKASWFNGELAELAWYPYQLGASQVSAQWKAAQDATGVTPVQEEDVTDPGNNTVTWKYDLLNGGRELSYTNAEGGTTSYGYDSGGFQDSVTDPNGHTTLTGHDARGNMVSKVTCQDQADNDCSTEYRTYYPAGNTTAQLTPDPRNDLVLTDADGRSASATDTTYQTTYTYDTSGDLTKKTTPPVAGFSSGRDTRYLYTNGTSSTGGYQGAVPPKGLPYQETTPGGAVTATQYYADGDLAQVTTPDGQRTVYTYDGLGRKISQIVYSDSFHDGLTTTYTYDANGDLATQADPPVLNRVSGANHTQKVTTTYDPDGDVTSQVTADLTGEDSSRTVTRSYNSYDQVESQTDAANATTSYTYDGYGNKASQTDPDSNLTDYTYDGDGHLLTTTLKNYTGSPRGSKAPADLREETRTYDPAGQLQTVTNAAPDTTGDEAGQQQLTNYTYYDNGLLAGTDVVTPDWSQDFTSVWNSYDGAGNLVEKWTANGETDTTYQVDAADRVTEQTTDPSGLDRTTSITYTPDDKQKVVTSGGPDGVSQTTSYTYDPAGNELSQSVTDPGSGGPVAWFNLSQPSGTAVLDSITGGPSAVASGVTWDSSEGTFSGSAGSQVSTAGPVLDTTGSFTVAAWVNLTSRGTGNQAVVSQAAGTNNGFELRYNHGTGNWELARPLTDSSGSAVAVAGSGAAATATTGTFTFLAGTYNAATGTMTLYVNGTPAGTATDTTPVEAAGAFTIGSAKSGGAQGDWFHGQAADVQIYPRALSADDVGQLWGSTDGGDITTSALTTTWTRDQRGLPLTMTTPDGQVTKYFYDEAGQLAMTTMPQVAVEQYGNATVPANPVTSTGYDTFGDKTETEDADGHTTTYGFDGDGRRVTQTLPTYIPADGRPAITNATSVTAYDGDGLVTSVTDPLTNKTKYDYDQLGDQVLVTAPDNSTTATAYDDNREPVQVTGPTGAVTDTSYDYMGRKSTSTQVERNTGAGTAQYTTTYSYGDDGGPDAGGGQLTHQASNDGVTQDIAYDAAGEKTAVADGQGETTSYQYDSLGRQTATDYPDGSSDLVGYDPLGDVTSTQQYDASNNLTASTSASFDGEGDQLSATDADGNSTTLTYDATGLLTAEVQPVTATTGISTSFGYDGAGNQVRYTDGNGGSWYDTYNTWGLQELRVEPAAGSHTSQADSAFTTSYDADGRPVTLAEPGGDTITNTYNNLSELTGQSGTGTDAAPTPNRTFGYDLAGDLNSATTTSAGGSAATSETFTYNDRGLVMTATGSGGSANYTYNGDGQVASVTDAAGKTSYTYDNVGRLATLADPATVSTATYTYYPNSQVKTVSYGSGKDVQTYGYDGQHRLNSDTLTTSSGTLVAKVGYVYDPDGHLTTQTATNLAGPSHSAYTYDEAGRLATWNNGTATTSYGYDPNGNLTQDGAKTYHYDARNELTSDGTGTYTYTARGTPSSEPGPSGSLAVNFDAYGDQATAGTNSYTYDALGRLTTTTPTTGTARQVSYVGATGAIASDGTTGYSWDPSGTTVFAAGNPGGGGGKLALTNVHGDVIGQFTSTATGMAASRAYDPWGTATTTNGTLGGSLGYQSALTDSATGKDLMGARWYNPGTGGFTSADTIPQPPVPGAAAGNPFAYAGDDPLTNTDPSGHCPACVVGAGVGTVIEPGGGTAVGWFIGAVVTVAAAVVVGTAVSNHTSAPAPAPAKAPATALPNTQPVPVIKPVITTVPKAPAKSPTTVIPNDGSNTGATTHPPTTAKPTSGSPAKGPTNGPPAANPPGSSQAPQNPNQDLTSPNADQHSIQQQIAALIAAGAGGTPAQPPTGNDGNDGNCPPDPADLINLAPDSSQDQPPGSGGQSFTPDTRILIPGGKTASISSLKPGDKVIARDLKTGKDQAEAVTAVEVHHDTDLYDLKVKTAHGTEVIHTTASHLFYDPSLNKFIPADHLKKGERLQTPNGTIAIANGGVTPKVHDGLMWDLTVPGNNDHDFYVVTGVTDGRQARDLAAGSTPILVHNCDPTLPRHAATCECNNGAGEITGVSPKAGDLVVLGKMEVGEPLAQREGGMTFNGRPYQFFQGTQLPQWVREVKMTIVNPNIKIAIDLGGLPAEEGWNAMDIFRAAADRGKLGWENGAGTDWEMRQIQIASARDPELAGRISWYLNGEDVGSQMTGSLLP